tara:strand:- start:203 stop:523 length:321 start_codon:yes stop_codon:yes gene_type:complete
MNELFYISSSFLINFFLKQLNSKNQTISQQQEVIKNFDCSPQVEKALNSLNEKHLQELENNQLSEETINRLWQSFKEPFASAGLNYNDFQNQLVREVQNQGFEITA